jgi:hypothetical protein
VTSFISAAKRKMPIENTNQIASVTNNNDLVFSQCFSAFDMYTSLFLVITNQNHNHYEGFEKNKNCSY